MQIRFLLRHLCYTSQCLAVTTVQLCVYHKANVILRLLAHVLINDTVNNTLSSAMPNIQQMLFQYPTVYSHIASDIMCTTTTDVNTTNEPMLNKHYSS